MMKKLFTAVLSAVAMAVPFFASANTAPQTEQSAVQPEKAKGVWIDVRSAEEFNAGHLQDAVNIPHDKIIEGVKAIGSDKMHRSTFTVVVVAVLKPHSLS